MRIGINVSWVGVQAAGVETYLRNLVRGLVAIDKTAHYVLLSTHAIPDDLLAGAGNIESLLVQPSTSRLHVPFVFSRAIASAHLDLVHEQTSAPFLFGAPLVVTIHDLYHEHYPQHVRAAQLMRMRLFMPLTAHRAAAIITDSRFSQADIIKRYRVAPEKVVVAYLAPDPMYQPLRDAARLAAVRARYGTGERFLLFVGALKPNKNLKRVVEAYVRLRRADALRHRLVLVGPKAAWMNDDIFTVARAAGYTDDVILTGYIPDEDVVSLYNAAEVFVHPSLFEGFGLPPLEAMACGTPVITSNTTALPEVVGEAAVQVDPLDVEALAGALARVTGDAGLRGELRARGLERAGQFTWEKTARQTLRVYHEAAKARSAAQ